MSAIGWFLLGTTVGLLASIVLIALANRLPIEGSHQPKE